MLARHRPEVIFLDAVGTLFGVRGSVGQIYSTLARDYGVEVEPEVLNQAFLSSFRHAPPMAFPGVDAAEIPQYELDWWHGVARQTFEQAHALEQVTNFSEFFATLYAHFATAEPWFVYPDVYDTLTRWRNQGMTLGVVSNFDSRIHAVLEVLHLSKFVSTVTISTEVGAAKPHPRVFAAALKKHGCRPSEALHIGDSLREDYQGARAAGLQAVWLKRQSD